MEVAKIVLSDYPRLQRLLGRGQISLGIHVVADGMDTWVRVNQPHPKLGITAAQSMTLADADELLAKLDSPVSVKIQLGPKGGVSLQRVSAPPGTQSELTLDDAKRIAPKSVNKSGSMATLPMDSLTVHDLGFTSLELHARAKLVAHKLKGPNLISRIASQREVLHVPGSTNLDEWWDRATPKQRFTLLSRHKKSGEKDDTDFSALQYTWRPFLGPPGELPTTPSVSEEEFD